MTNADCWGREWCGPHRAGGPAATARVWPLHKGEHAAAIDLKAVPGVGAGRGCVRRPVVNERYTAAGGTGVGPAERAGGFDRER